MECHWPDAIYGRTENIYIYIHNIDVVLISETLFTEKSYLKLPSYTNYPAGTAQVGTAIIKNSVKHHELNHYSQHFLQASSVSVKDLVGFLTILAVYLPHRCTVKQERFDDFYSTLGHWFITGGDYNAKYASWRFRLITPKEYELLKTVENNNLKHLSMGELTYWPFDMNKLQDLVNICVAKGIHQDFTVVKSCFDLSSSSLLMTTIAHALNQEKQ
jgi:hypothetical protein